MSESNGNGNGTVVGVWPSNLLHLILDRGEILESLEQDRADSAAASAEFDAARLKYQAASRAAWERRQAKFRQIDRAEDAIKDAIAAEAERMGQVPQSIVLSGYDTAFMIESDGGLVEYQMVNAIRLPLPAPPLDAGAGANTAATPRPAVAEAVADDADDDDSQDFDLDNRIGLTPAGRILGKLIACELPEAPAPRVDWLSDEELMESAAYETLHDYVSPAAADAWHAAGSPLDGHAVAAMADEDGFVPASALGAMREAARAQAFAGTDAVAIDNEVS